MHPDLKTIIACFESGEPLHVVAFGDSITAGSQIGRTPDESIVYHKQWRDRLAQCYPKLNMHIDNRGVPGHRISDAHERLQAEVIDAKPNMVIVAFGINDTWLGPDNLDRFESELARLVDRIREALPGTVIVLMTTNMYAFKATDAAVEKAWFAKDTARYQNEGWTDQYMQCVRKVSADKGIALADGYAEWERARARGVDTDQLLANGANHPNAEGHSLLANAFDRLFEHAPGR